MIRIKLAEDDRVKLELPEWIEYDPSRPRLSDLRRVKAEVGWEWSQVEGSIDDADMDKRTAARAVMVWLAVHKHNPVTWDEFDLDLFGVEYEPVNDPNSPAPNGADE